MYNFKDKGGVFMEFDELLLERKNRILNFIKSEDYKTAKRADICVMLQVPKNDRPDFDRIIDALINEGEIIETKKGKIMLPSELNLVVANFSATAKGFGFARIPDSNDDDIYIPEESVNGAMHKDKVLVRIVTPALGTKKAQGEIVRVIERARSEIVGTFEEGNGFGFVICDDHRTPDIFIPKESTKGAVDGSKVAVKITKIQTGNRSPEGEIVDILGHKDDPGVDILSIIRQFELPQDYPQEVYDQTEKLPEEISQAEIEGREDLREKVTFTIDGDDSKDFDDAVSLDILENGNFELGVHIADVTHYVTENSPLDKEAYKRGTSFYLVDRVIPMIPHRLSNGICSLNPNVDRLTLSCIMEINRAGEVVNHRIVKSVIHSHCRMTYTKVNNVIEKKDAEQMAEYEEFVPILNDMDKLRQILNSKRKKRGSVNFDFPEAKIKLDENGKPLEIVPYDRNSATNLIEEFMLVCNETVAEDYFWRDLPFVYRNHEAPNEEKILAMKKMITNFGYHFKGQNELYPKDIQQLIEKTAGGRYEHIISRIVLRSMKQAKYQDENLGHFGLAAKYYCHFTSPIRRYPDLQIHRIIKENIDGRLSEKKINKYRHTLSEIAAHCSVMERVADDAERETDKLKMAEYMQDHIGEEYDGVISGVTGWGIYVELPNTVEGMVALNGISDDFYNYEEENLRVVGKHTGKIYMLGDSVRVKVIRADAELRTIDFELVSKEEKKKD
jgi:ribonuclease R